MPFLLPLLALLLLSAAPTVTEVVTSMSVCNAYFLNKAPPQIRGILEGGKILDQNQYKPICQTLNDSRTFVTLYDTTNKIPVFSAYKYTGKKKIARPTWMIEPQLEDINAVNKAMRIEEEGKCYINQAVNTDYNDSKEYNKGHLLPFSYGSNENGKNSTCTLTNSVPQVKSFNSGSWSSMETCVKCVLDRYCKDASGKTEGFVVIGARPGNNLLNNKVNIPSMLWSAFCCYSSSEGAWLAGAHWGDNIPHGGRVLQTKTLDELHRELLAPSEVFPGTHCPLHTTVTHLYSQLSMDCKCPAPVSTTSAAPTTASTPPVSTSASLPTTSGPVSTTSGPFTTTSGPVSTTSGPLTTTSGPDSTTSGTFTSTPPSTTSRPPTTTGHAATTTSTPSTPAPATLSTIKPTTTGTPATTILHTTTLPLTTTYFSKTTKPQTTTSHPTTRASTTTTKTTAATTSTTKVTITTTTTKSTTTTKKRKKDKNDKDWEKARNDGSTGGDKVPAGGFVAGLSNAIGGALSAMAAAFWRLFG